MGPADAVLRLDGPPAGEPRRRRQPAVHRVPPVSRCRRATSWAPEPARTSSAPSPRRPTPAPPPICCRRCAHPASWRHYTVPRPPCPGRRSCTCGPWRRLVHGWTSPGDRSAGAAFAEDLAEGGWRSAGTCSGGFPGRAGTVRLPHSRSTTTRRPSTGSPRSSAGIPPKLTPMRGTTSGAGCLLHRTDLCRIRAEPRRAGLGVLVTHVRRLPGGTVAGRRLMSEALWAARPRRRCASGSRPGAASRPRSPSCAPCGCSCARLLSGAGRPPGAADDDVDRLLLAFEELVSNGLRHGGDPVRAVVTDRRSGWLLEVSDAAGDTPPVPAVGRDAALGGLGLYLVAQLSARPRLDGRGRGPQGRLGPRRRHRRGRAPRRPGERPAAAPDRRRRDVRPRPRDGRRRAGAAAAGRRRRGPAQRPDRAAPVQRRRDRRRPGRSRSALAWLASVGQRQQQRAAAATSRSCRSRPCSPPRSR